MPSFTAIDFETADHQRDSACAIAMVRVQRGRIVDRQDALIRPPRREVLSTWIHGLTWDDLRDADPFAVVWARLSHMLDGSAFLVAHNAAFDRGVLSACCRSAGLQPPALRWICTVDVAKRTWGRAKNGLPEVCRGLGIPLDHHDAASDALACARIALAAHARGALVAPDLVAGIRAPPRPGAPAALLRARRAWLFAPRP
jgi:DNA polymerase III subunit epsilon